MTPVFYIWFKLGGNTSYLVIIAWKVNAPHAILYLWKTPLIHRSCSPRICIRGDDCEKMRRTELITICCEHGYYFVLTYGFCHMQAYSFVSHYIPLAAIFFLWDTTYAAFCNLFVKQIELFIAKYELLGDKSPNQDVKLFFTFICTWLYIDICMHLLYMWSFYIHSCSQHVTFSTQTHTHKKEYVWCIAPFIICSLCFIQRFLIIVKDFFLCPKKHFAEETGPWINSLSLLLI